MMRISVWDGGLDEGYLRQVTQLGADCIDFGRGDAFPGTKEQGYPDLDSLLQIRARIRSWGLDINRVTLPDITERFMENLPGCERELENTCAALQVYGQAGIPVARQRFAGDTFPGLTHQFQATHRGGYRARAESLNKAADSQEWMSHQALDVWWQRFCEVYARLVPVAEQYHIGLAVHPSDTPLPGTPLGSLGFHRVADAFPSPSVGYLFCIGTRAEAGGSSLVLDEITNYGRKGRILAVHVRNVRGSLPTSGGFEETLLDDGDMNMFQILVALERVGYCGCLNPDHIPKIEGDSGHTSLGLAYSIGYIKALLAALAITRS
jgi:mannonate dehydratase